ncbi:hypothetical protein NOZE110980_16640 [Nocardioides zeicaulis]
MERGDPAGDGQAQPGPAGAVGAEALEDPLAVLRCHPCAGVDDLEPPRPSVRPAGDGHRRAGRCVAAGVVEDVDQQLSQPVGVGADDQVGRDLHRCPAVAARRGDLGGRDLDQVAQGDLAAVEIHHAGLEPGQPQQVVGQPAQPLRLRQCGLQVIPIGRHDPVGEVLQQGGHGGQRGAQLVGDGGDEVAALAVDGLEVLGHGVERRCEASDLVGRRGPHPPRVVAAGHRPRHLGHPPQRLDHPGREQLGHPQRERDTDREHQPRRDVGRGAEQGEHDRRHDRRDDEQPELGLDAGDRRQRRARRTGRGRWRKTHSWSSSA